MLIAAIVIIVIIALVLFGMPIAVVLLLAGFGGYCIIAGWDVGLALLSIRGFEIFHCFTFLCVPLFILMGFIAAEAGFIRDAYETARKWMAGLPGGLAAATTVACAFFGAVCGSSIAMAGAMGVIAYPEMRKANYDRGFAAGCIGIGGTIGILIPPSLPMITYGIILDQPIGTLFIAGLFPGILLTLLLIGAIFIQVKLNPNLAPKIAATYSIKEKILSLKGLVPILVLFLIVIGGIYGGLFTPTEAASLGSFAALFMALGLRRLNKEQGLKILRDVIPVSGMLFLVFFGAIILSAFMIISGAGKAMGEFIVGLNVPDWVVLIAMAIVYLLLGMLMDIVGMLMITLPIFSSIILAMDFDFIWFGVFCTILGEACLITPPVGLNVYVLAGTIDAPLEEIFKKVLLYLPVLLLLLVIIYLFPQIALFLPNTMS